MIDVVYRYDQRRPVEYPRVEFNLQREPTESVASALEFVTRQISVHDSDINANLAAQIQFVNHTGANIVRVQGVEMDAEGLSDVSVAHRQRQVDDDSPRRREYRRMIYGSILSSSDFRAEIVGDASAVSRTPRRPRPT